MGIGRSDGLQTSGIVIGHLFVVVGSRKVRREVRIDAGFGLGQLVELGTDALVGLGTLPVRSKMSAWAAWNCA